MTTYQLDFIKNLTENGYITTNLEMQGSVLCVTFVDPKTGEGEMHEVSRFGDTEGSLFYDISKYGFIV